MDLTDNKQKLVFLTRRLLDLTELAKQQYRDVKETGDSPDFEKIVKPFADDVRNTVNEWKVLAVKWINAERPNYVYENQINTTVNLMEALSVQVFFPNTSKKHVLSSIQSTEYVFNQLLTLIDTF